MQKALQALSEDGMALPAGAEQELAAAQRAAVEVKTPTTTSSHVGRAGEAG
jgi:hypothetical protein